ncbi:VCBS repeat-containing protein [Zhouia sp. PK063]|uniref:VCBS repeat-containing protein n=1 Tax=Zhouia sp. PK063 TaxID=3373602 RepID=UPI0037A96817
MNKFWCHITMLFLVSCSTPIKKEYPSHELFTEISPEQSQVYFSNNLQENNELNILDYLYFYNGGGVATGDINNDGLPDIFLVGNQVPNKLYLNKGNFVFEDITNKAGIVKNSSWNTGVTMADVNGDGFLDIYVCAVVGINNFTGHNQLYINNGDETFTEKAKEYHLDFQNYSTQSAFFDFDLDGDLDMYLLNHAVHTQDSYGKADIRNKRNEQTGDKLLRNDKGIFTDVSEQAGIYGGINGYGLGINIGDYNQDGYPDIYVSNDFHEDDYYYLNNGNGTFTESLKKYFGHTSRFSMGNDAADINHDAMPDIVSLDMLPEDETVLKASDGDDNVQMLKMRTERLGYHYQFTRNMLQMNQGTSFSETALESGIAATDWSWSALLEDYDQDGEQDLLITNGIPKRPNDLDYIKFISNDQIRKELNNTNLVDQKAIEMMPDGSVHNYIFKGNGNGTFIDVSTNWISDKKSISNGAAFADFDNDGDLDLVINNIGNTATILQNKTNQKANSLVIKFNYTKGNKFGVGTKVYSYSKGILQYKEMHPTRGFESSSQPIIHFGYGTTKTVDSLIIVWPDRTFQKIKNIKTNTVLNISADSIREKFIYNDLAKNKKAWFTKVANNLGINFTHEENNFVDFNRQKLIPYQISDRGPATAIGDLNGDGKDDIFFGGSKYTPAQTYLQTENGFELQQQTTISSDSIAEDYSAAIFDVNNDNLNDIFVVSGGGEFYNNMNPLLDRLYLKNSTGFTKHNLPEYFENGYVIKANDYNNDGKIDVFVGSGSTSYNFGKIPNSYLLKNTGNGFEIDPNESLQQAGMITDAIWTDFDNDGTKDLIVVGEWMQPTFFKNANGKLTEVKKTTQKLNGLWQSIIPFDIDGDGDIDYVLGNWGTNTKFKASATFPMKMYYDDFDHNGNTETIVATEKNGNYYPILGLDELSGQLISLTKKKYTNYKSFAGKTVEEIFGKEILNHAAVLQVHTLESGYLENNNGNFTFKSFLPHLQVAPINCFVAYDFDGDGKTELLAAGNYFGVKPYHSRFDGFSGAIIKNSKTSIPAYQIGIDFTQKAVRHLNIITHKNRSYILATINNKKAEVYEINN